jgi:hypothetical protein
MVRWARLVAAVPFVAAAVALGPAPSASARSAYDSSYGFDRTWNAGLRLVRVDLGLKVTEKDEANGYLLFDYRSPESSAKPCPGSMEFIKSKDDGSVRVVVQIPQMPGYHEQVMIDSLARKLRTEYGDPPKRPTPSPQKDAGPPDAEP